MRTFPLALVLLVLWPPLCALGVQFQYGKYVGAIQMEGSQEQMAVTLDVFLVRRADPADFPQMEAVLRANLGGYFSSEYVTYDYYDASYNFDKKILYLQSHDRDLSATLTLSAEGKSTVLKGPVSFRPTQSSGQMRVVWNGVGDSGFGLPFQPKLSGEYFGKCGDKDTDLQIETAKGSDLSALNGNGLTGYAITGRLGYDEGELCSAPDSGFAPPVYCEMYAYSSGLFYPFNGSLTLTGNVATLQCHATGNTLTCSHQVEGRTESCALTKAAENPTPFLSLPAKFSISRTPEEKQPLPVPNPPDNEELLKALNGNFYGFLHYENRDEYQPMQLGIIASSSTENDHVQNRVFISPTLSLLFGSSWTEGGRYSIPLPRMSFYTAANFTLQSDDAADVLVISQWTQGYIKGVWYSKKYGRVGTFELVKDRTPLISNSFPETPKLEGDFAGPFSQSPWELHVVLPAQAAKPGETTAALTGTYAMSGGNTAQHAFAHADYDYYTGSISFLLEDGGLQTLVSGTVLSSGDLNLVWPAAPHADVLMNGYGLNLFHQEN